MRALAKTIVMFGWGEEGGVTLCVGAATTCALCFLWLSPMQCMSEEAVAAMYIQQAQRVEREGNLKLAERLYLIVEEPDLAVNMCVTSRL